MSSIGDGQLLRGNSASSVRVGWVDGEGEDYSRGGIWTQIFLNIWRNMNKYQKIFGGIWTNMKTYLEES